MDTEICEVVITAADGEWLAQFNRELVAERLCACGHNFGAILSIYRWEGAIREEREARLALHTRRTLVPRILARTRQAHPYEVPCLIVLPVIDANPDYIDWVLNETLDD